MDQQESISIEELLTENDKQIETEMIKETAIDKLYSREDREEYAQDSYEVSDNIFNKDEGGKEKDNANEQLKPKEDVVSERREVVVSDIASEEKNVFIEMEKKSYLNNSKLSLSKLLHVFPYPVKEDVHNLTEKPPECYTIQYSKSRTFAMGFSSGEIDVIMDYSKRIQFKVSTDPISSLRFHPERQTTILAITSIGEVLHLHSLSGRKLSEFTIENNALRALDYNKKGDQFVIGTSSGEVLLYSESMQILERSFMSGTSFSKGHVDQVHSVLFPMNEPNAIISGGRDKRVVLWDIRSSMASSMLVGPLIMGDSIDFKNNELLTGSYDVNDGIQLWDMRTMKALKTFKVNSMTYCCKFSKAEKSNLFACGGYKKNDLKVFNAVKETANVSGINAATYPIYSLDFSIDGKYLLFGSEDGGARVVEI